MKLRRQGDRKRYPFRNQRLCCENGKWYFQTREGTLIGPCADRGEAQRLLAVFLAKTLRQSQKSQDVTSNELVGAQDGVQELVEELLEFYRLRAEISEAAAHAWAINRVEDLGNDLKIQNRKERMDILYYVMDRG